MQKRRLLGLTIVTIFIALVVTMAERLDVNDVLERLEDDDFGLSSGEESEFEGDEVYSYLPPASDDLSGHVAGGGALQTEGSDSGGEESDDASPGPSTSYQPGQ